MDKSDNMEFFIYPDRQFGRGGGAIQSITDNNTPPTAHATSQSTCSTLVFYQIMTRHLNRLMAVTPTALKVSFQDLVRPFRSTLCAAIAAIAPIARATATVDATAVTTPADPPSLDNFTSSESDGYTLFTGVALPTMDSSSVAGRAVASELATDSDG